MWDSWIYTSKIRPLASGVLGTTYKTKELQVGIILITAGYLSRKLTIAVTLPETARIILQAISYTADIRVITLITLALYIINAKRHEIYKKLAFSILATGLIVAITKILVESPRPSPYSPAITLLEKIDVYSYPSGHAAGSMVYAYYAWKTDNYKHLFLAWTLLVGASRILLGYHYIGDVLAGYGIGIITAYLFYNGLYYKLKDIFQKTTSSNKNGATLWAY
ncbi:MAG: phosphatase PAP2 family protein [Desulfurococcales archaeon]|nr:phosphatase PAP2 family protein [Desulfurococcales archaeon]MEB3789486.1 phosphatase PAP2 family protein [Desulfurococcales archaeon]